MSTELDHLVVSANNLEEGRAWCRDLLGAEPTVGGKHAAMGTHNLLLQLSSSRYKRCYLEIIAIDPEAGPASRMRWFGLDQRPEGPPRLVQWVVRSNGLDMHRWGLMHQGVTNPGDLVAFTRGNLRWKMLLNATATMPVPLPMLLQWTSGHPCDALPDSGVQLESLAVDGLPPGSARVLAVRGNDGQSNARPGLRARLKGPKGSLELVADWAQG